jgi:predicted small lipoprotein YifL
MTVSLPLLVISCGQPGPLYLPGSAPPIYVPKEQQESQDKEQEIQKNQEEEQQ